MSDDDDEFAVALQQELERGASDDSELVDWSTVVDPVVPLGRPTEEDWARYQMVNADDL